MTRLQASGSWPRSVLRAVETRTALRLGLVLVVAVLAALPGSTGGSVDLLPFSAAGARLLSPSWAHVFGQASLQSGPLQLLCYDGLRVLSAALHVREQVVFAVAMQLAASLGSMWFVTRLGELTDRLRAPLFGAGAGLLASSLSLLGDGWWFGHAAEIAVPLLWLGALRAGARDRALLAGLYVGLSAGFETWGLLGVALLLAARGVKPLAVSLLAAGAAIAALYLPFVLGGPFRMFQMHWAVSDGTLVAVLTSGRFGWPLRMLQAALSVASGAAALRMLRRRPAAAPLAIVALLLVRIVFDPLGYAYYWLPVRLACVVLTASARRGAPLWVLSPLLLAVTVVVPELPLYSRTALAMAEVGVAFLLIASRSGASPDEQRHPPVQAAGRAALQATGS